MFVSIMNSCCSPSANSWALTSCVFVSIQHCELSAAYTINQCQGRRQGPPPRNPIAESRLCGTRRHSGANESQNRPEHIVRRMYTAGTLGPWWNGQNPVDASI